MTQREPVRTTKRKFNSLLSVPSWRMCITTPARLAISWRDSVLAGNWERKGGGVKGDGERRRER